MWDKNLTHESRGQKRQKFLAIGYKGCLYIIIIITCKHLSPAEGSSLHPTVTTGVEGGALFTGFICSFSIALTLTHV